MPKKQFSTARLLGIGLIAVGLVLIATKPFTMIGLNGPYVEIHPGEDYVTIYTRGIVALNKSSSWHDDISLYQNLGPCGAYGSRGSQLDTWYIDNATPLPVGWEHMTMFVAKKGGFVQRAKYTPPYAKDKDNDGYAELYRSGVIFLLYKNNIFSLSVEAGDTVYLLGTYRFVADSTERTYYLYDGYIHDAPPQTQEQTETTSTGEEELIAPAPTETGEYSIYLGLGLVLLGTVVLVRRK